MTEVDLKLRGYPGGDADLAATFRRVLGREPDYVISDPGWVRELMFEDVSAALKRQAAGRREPAPLDVPRLGNWHADRARK